MMESLAVDTAGDLDRAAEVPSQSLPCEVQPGSFGSRRRPVVRRPDREPLPPGTTNDRTGTGTWICTSAYAPGINLPVGFGTSISTRSVCESDAMA